MLEKLNSMPSWIRISHRQIIGILLGVALVGGLALICSLAVFQNSETARALQIQLFYCERQLSTVRAVALDSVLWVAVSDETKRDGLSSEIRMAANSIETVQSAALFGESKKVSLERKTSAYISALRELVDGGSSELRERELLSMILAAARGELRIELEQVAESLFKQQNLSRNQAHRIQSVVLIGAAVILAFGAAILFRRVLRMRQ